MVRRTASLIAAAAALGGAGWSLASPLGEGHRAPRLAPRPPEVEVVWVSTAEDFLACETAANGLRRARSRRGGPEVRLVLVGDDGGLAEGYLRSQRLESGLLRLSRGEFRRRFGRTEIPALYVAREGRVVRLWMGSGEVRRATAGERPPLLSALEM
jgi:hypothetical protein